MERKADMLLSTLRGYIEAMGGELRLVATLPDIPSEVTIDLVPLRGGQSAVVRKAGRDSRATATTPRHAAQRADVDELLGG